MPPKFLFSIMLGNVDETNGDQPCPNKTNALLLSLKRRSILTQAKRNDGWLERIELTLRLLTRAACDSARISNGSIWRRRRRSLEKSSLTSKATSRAST